MFAEACSVVPVTKGTLRSQWVFEGQSEQPSPANVLSTSDLAVAEDRSLFVVDKFESRVVHLDSAGLVLQEWGRAGDGPAEFRSPTAISIGTDGRIYVADRSGRIAVFSGGGVLHNTLRVSAFDDITDLVVLPGRNMVVATDAKPLEGRGPYVAIIDSTGATVREVLNMARPGAGRARPLLAHEMNPVRLSRGVDGRFAVWYPIDNYVELFSSTGAPLGSVQGCLSNSLKEGYAGQRRRASGYQTHVVVTLGVSIDDSSDVRVVSFHRRDKQRTIRVRRYSQEGEEKEARDFDVSNLGFLDRFEFLRHSELIGFNTVSREIGVRRFWLQ